MLSGLPMWVERTFSAPRFGPYLNAFPGDWLTAWNLYRWNMEVSAAFYIPLQCLEISLRNAEHDRLRAHYGHDDWWRSAPLGRDQLGKVAKAENDACRKGDRRASPDDIVAELPFGFWASLLNRAHDRYLWVPVLHRAFPGYRGDRETLRDNFRSVVLLRNRIMHHEPIHHRHLTADHDKIYRLLGYIEPEVIVWARASDQVPEVLTRRPQPTPP
ncbi:Abi family protein [Nonomuraea roseoviolacea subsp. roseoviolacea]|uniref:Abi family protein n=1 Tax=Nonomuraea roseoviolacea subsp. carminata TaxID=160689 RepID=A0ABT1JZZ4_9ACTN|nr:hypothetical protein [Nonomuraea roseoviolacea]MCP2347321.1 hypothetical protein [Nonomuraea roseoviolacea subsp. carminata]